MEGSIVFCCFFKLKVKANFCVKMSFQRSCYFLPSTVQIGGAKHSHFLWVWKFLAYKIAPRIQSFLSLNVIAMHLVLHNFNETLRRWMKKVKVNYNSKLFISYLLSNCDTKCFYNFKMLWNVCCINTYWERENEDFTSKIQNKASEYGVRKKLLNHHPQEVKQNIMWVILFHLQMF